MAVRRTQMVQTPGQLAGEIVASVIVNSRTQNVQPSISAQSAVIPYAANLTNVMSLKDASFGFGATIVSGGGGGGPVIVGQTTSYRLRGWNNTTKAFVHWTGPTPTTPPPGGVTLQDISYVEFEA